MPPVVIIHHSQKSFAERAQELKAREEAEAAAARAREQVENKQAQLLATEGPAKARASAEQAINYVEEQIRLVGQSFSIPQHPQTNAQLEVIVRDRWLMTGTYYTTTFTIATYDLENNSGSRAKPMAQSSVAYEIAVDAVGAFYWAHKSNTSSARGAIYSPGSGGNLVNLTDGTCWQSTF